MNQSDQSANRKQPQDEKGSRGIELIASDLDGTLLDSDGILRERTIAAIQAAERLGVTFTISTGRMFSSAGKFARQAGVKVPIICYNGAMLCHLDGTVISHDTLDMDVARRLLAIFRERGTYVQSYVDDVLYVKDLHDSEYQDYMKHYGIYACGIGDALYEPQAPPTKLLATTDNAEESALLMRELTERFKGSVYVTSSNSEFVEMMNPNVNKAKGLETLAGMLGIEMRRVMAIGDGENDVEMLRQAGLGVAMGNGRQHAKDAAQEVAPTNDDFGAAWAIEKFAIGRLGN